MKSNLKSEAVIALKIFFVLSIILGVMYPLTITWIARMTMPEKANGSLITSDGRIVGSKLIGQQFSDSTYFHSRPSAVDNNAAGSGGSNLGPSSQKLMDIVKEQVAETRRTNSLASDVKIPADMVLASASGLDPHISVQNALLQAPRIARTRSLSGERIRQLIEQHTDPDFIGVWGQKGVNVLSLNLALDQLSKL
ncbi:MAG: K(+)-transporting ATPase subunit C [Candidatus Zhuqueibacterota bacterium]